MPTIFSHAVVPLCVAMAAGRQTIPPRVAVAGMLLAMLPDADVLSFRLGVSYAENWGHRGATHSIAIAVAAAALVTLLMRTAKPLLCSLFLFLAAISHALLDMATNGGLGVALFWPFETQRHFWDWRPIRVSPIGRGFFSERGLDTLISELRWVWLPMLALAMGGQMLRRLRAQRTI